MKKNSRQGALLEEQEVRPQLSVRRWENGRDLMPTAVLVEFMDRRGSSWKVMWQNEVGTVCERGLALCGAEKQPRECTEVTSPKLLVRFEGGNTEDLGCWALFPGTF